jgi:hypothetical protein
MIISAEALFSSALWSGKHQNLFGTLVASR